VAAVLFLATIIRSAFGFGEALVAVPLLALAIPVEVAAPVAVLASIKVALIVVVQDWRSIHLRSAIWLVAPTLFGIPLGLIVLKTVPEAVDALCSRVPDSDRTGPARASRPVNNDKIPDDQKWSVNYEEIDVDDRRCSWTGDRMGLHQRY
jgi:hypothetical protein